MIRYVAPTRAIAIEADYYEHVEVPMYVRDDPFPSSRRRHALSVPADPLDKVMSWERARTWRASAARAASSSRTACSIFCIPVTSTCCLARDEPVMHSSSASTATTRFDASRDPSGPFAARAERCYVLAALAMVDAVVVFEQDTPLELISAAPSRRARQGRRLLPNRRSSARREVRGWGGEVVVIPLTPGHSTTSTIERLRGH